MCKGHCMGNKLKHPVISNQQERIKKSPKEERKAKEENRKIQKEMGNHWGTLQTVFPTPFHKVSVPVYCSKAYTIWWTACAGDGILCSRGAEDEMCCMEQRMRCVAWSSAPTFWGHDYVLGPWSWLMEVQGHKPSPLPVTWTATLCHDGIYHWFYIFISWGKYLYSS